MSSPSARDGSDVAVAAPGEWQCNVFYQDDNGAVRQSIHNKGNWSHTTTPTFTAKPSSPLAAISFDGGKEVRVYCVSGEGYLEEYGYSSNKPGWWGGALNKLRFRVAAASKVAAVYWNDNRNIRVYVQDPDNKVQELVYDNSGGWRKGASLPVAQDGSSLAVVRWEKEGRSCLRVYYQARDSSTVKEHCYENSKWFEGEFSIPDIPPYASITAVVFRDAQAGVHLRVFLQDSSASIIAYHNDGGWVKQGAVVGPLRPGRRIAALEWREGTELRVFYQADDNKIREQAQSNAGAWYKGEYEA
ncbi:fucose-specific lectin [Xylaria bambusicola]|uniref:fucose-specific lectin n=1 Tax=Xylaria bambusicola TaxID=326684 RepID=UPI00200771CE|nr:fucose-specific lectin [Xylaria bambusicola]KAI0503254.1 fucose-specific lectin [Xylaria bambusicola]